MNDYIFMILVILAFIACVLFLPYMVYSLSKAQMIGWIAGIIENLEYMRAHITTMKEEDNNGKDD